MPEYTIAQYLLARKETLPLVIDPRLEYGGLVTCGSKIPHNQSKKLIVIGLGNPQMGDDGVGWVVVQALKDQLAQAEIETDLLAGGGLSLMERLVGYQAAILVDSIYTGCSRRGTVQTFPLEALQNPFTGHTSPAHETSLLAALEMGRNLGVKLPGQVMIVSVESPDIFEGDETLSPDVEAGVPEACRAVLRLLDFIIYTD